MRSELGKECRKLFKKVMADSFPQYEADKDQILPQGWYVWTYHHPNGISFHIVLVLSPKEDKFTLEVGWSLDGKLKASTSGSGRDEFVSKPDYVRLSQLWRRYGWDHWWDLTPPGVMNTPLSPAPIGDCMQRVAPAIHDARSKLLEHAMPCFEEIGIRHEGASH